MIGWFRRMGYMCDACVMSPVDGMGFPKGQPLYLECLMGPVVQIDWCDLVWCDLMWYDLCGVSCVARAILTLQLSF